MRFLLAEYAQRLLFTVFLTAFGAYLLIAMLTYTPYDPGWSHLSSDTLQVTNASGVAGAWIADLMYGFLGRASLLVPVMVLLEAVQIWWPHSFVARPFRVAAQVFLLVIIASLCSLHVLEPADTMQNAAGGILGFELSSRLMGLLGMWPLTLFLVLLLLLMLTLAFGIRWDRTLDSAGQLPSLLRELFYRNQPEPSAVGPHGLVDATMIVPEPLTAQPVEPAQMSPTLQVAIAGAAVSAASDRTDQVENAIQDHPESMSSTRIEPTFDWEDQSVFNELLEAVPTPEVATSTPEATDGDVDPFDHVLSLMDEALAEPQSVIEEPLAPVLEPAELLEPSALLEPSVAIEAGSPHEVDAALNGITDSLQPIHEPAPEVWAIPEATSAKVTVDDLLLTAGVVAEPVVTPVEMIPVAEVLPVVAPVAATVLPVVSQQQQPATPEPVVEQPASKGIRINPLTPEQIAAELDAPLTDAMGRPMSRSMQVAQHRAGLSRLPSMDLLDEPDPNRKPSYTEEDLERLSELLEIKLQEFNVKARVVEAQPGPVVTRFELELAPGLKASKVTNISSDLARSMSMASVRVVPVIPGKPYIGIEVPNKSREMVRLSELLKAPAYLDPTALISMAMGKDIAGRPVLADLAKAPHMLVAGTTGSGKSVAVNAMLLSMLLKYGPDQLRLILIDPKQLELANYSDIPHLLTPVVTDMKDAVSALNWCVGEMERRYKLMTLFKVRKIDEFNRKVTEAMERGEDILDPLWKPEDSAVQDRAPRLKPLPLIVIVADEFADMIMQVGKKAEELITRLAQKSRAAGIHLMLATQRPSVDVITGLIKANIPTRVALRVNSKIDSRTILDAGGAEDMLGHGDMLFLAPGKIEPERVHGAFISDDEVNRICDAWRERGSPDYVDDILNAFDEEGGSKGGGYDSDGSGDPERDAMYDQVVAFVLETRKISASSIQRKFSLGYNRAARIVDAMEAAGIVSAMGPSGKRELLV